MTWRPLTTLIAVCFAAAFFTAPTTTRAQTNYVWTNGSGNWSLASAWTNNLAPTNGSALIFRGAAGTSTNNEQVSSLQSVTFSNTTGSIVLAGSAFAIGTNGIANLSGHAHTVSNNVSLFGATTFSATSNSLTFAGDVTNGGSLLTVAGSNNTAISGVISGAGGLAKTGAGTLTISGANNYSGGTLVSAGALSGNSSSIQGDVTNNAAVIFNQTANGDYAGLMSGSGSLTKNSGGTLTLSGANTFSGAIALNGGALSISAGNNLGSSTNAVAFSNAASLVTTASLSTARGFTGNGTLDIADGTTLTNSGTINMSQLTLANTGTFEMSGASKTFTVFSTNTYSLVFNAAATLTNTGAAALVGSVAASNSTGTAVMAGAYSVNNSYTFMVNNGAADTDLLVSGPISSPTAVLITKSGAGRLELLGTNSGFLGSFQLGQTNAAAAGEILIGNKDALGRHVFRLYSGTLMAGTDLTGANAITNQIELGGLVGTPAIIGGTNAIQLSGPVRWLSTASNTSALRVDNTTIISGTIATNTSTNAIDLSGNGTLVLSAENFQLVNALNIGSGLTVVAAQTNALGATNRGTTVASGGSLVISNLGYSPAEAVTISGTGVGGSGALRGAGTATFGGAITLGADATIAADSGASFSLFGGINAGGSTLILTGEGNTRFTGVISNGALLKLGSGTATMTGANTYTGGTLVSAGALQISNGGSVASTITNNALLIYNIVSFGATNTNAITGTGSLIKIGSGTVILSGANTYTGGTLVSAGALQVGEGGTTGSLAGTITNNASLVFDRSDNYTQSNAITGSGTLTKLRAGTLTLTADVTQSSTTIANSLGQGTLQIGNGGTSGSLSGTITGEAGTMLIFNRSDDYVLSNSIIGSATVTKLGAGTLTLTATNNAGGMLVSAGALQIGDGGTNGALTTIFNITNNASLIFNRSDNVTHSSPINGAGLLTKLGGATLTLTASNTQGGTLISEGALRINSVLSGPITNNARLILANDSANSYTQGGVISGTGSLIKLGAGTNVLTAANTYSGGTLVSGGALRVGNGFINGSLIGAVTNNALVIFDRSDNQTYASAITGTGSITKVNTGTLTLTADNTQPTIHISGGALQIGDGSTNGSLIAPRITNNASLIFNRSDNVLLTNETIGSISGVGSLRKLGAGTLTLGNTNPSAYNYSGGTLVSEGTLEIGRLLTIGGTLAVVTNNSKIVLNDHGSRINGFLMGTGTLEKVGAGTSTLVQGGTQTGATTVSGGRLLINANMSNSAITVNSGASLGGANMGTNSASLGALTVSGTLAPGASVFTDYGIGLLRARNTVFNTNGSFELNVANWSVASNVGTNGWDSLFVEGSLTLSNTSVNPFTVNLVSLTASNTLGLSTFDKNRNYTNIFVSVTGSVAGNAFSQDMFVVNTNDFQNPVNGSFSIITNKQSTITYLSLVYSTLFNAADAYIWTNGSGNWSLGSGWSNPSTTGLAPSNGATVVFSGDAGIATNNQVTSLASITFSNTTGSVRLAGNAFTIGTNGIANLSDNAHTISNAVTLGGAAAFNAASNNLTFAGTVANGGFLLSATGNSNTVVSGSISGSGGLAKTGAGTLTLSGANNYSGGTLVSAGTLQVGSGGTSGSLSSVITNNASLVFNRSDNVTHSSAINGAGLLTKLGGATLTLTASNTQGGTLISAGAVQIGNGGSTGFLSGPITNNSALVFNRFDNVTQSGAISGAGLLTKLASGTLTLTASNAQGGTLVSAGTLQIGNGGTTGSLGGPITNNSALVINRSDNLTQSGAISGTGSLRKLGAGTVTMTANNAFSGATAIDAGRLVVNGTNANSAVTVAAGASLAGSGTVGTIAGAGSIDPGNSPGITTATSVDPSGGLTFNFEFTSINPSFSNASASLNDVLRLTDLSTPFVASLASLNTVNIYFNVSTFVGAQVYSGAFFTDANVSFLSQITNATFNYYLEDAFGTNSFEGQTYSALPEGLSIVVTTAPQSADFGAGTVNGQISQFEVVPEPSTYALLLMTGAGALYAWGRRRRSNTK